MIYPVINMLLGSAMGCFGSTCISLCGWKGVILSLSLPLPSLCGWNRRVCLLALVAILGAVASSLCPAHQPHTADTERGTPPLYTIFYFIA